jgi:hypothetical protein
MDIVLNLLKCQLCHKEFSGVPLILNCCNATICSQHLEYQTIEFNESKKRKIFECKLCMCSHDMSNKKFATNQTVENLLKHEFNHLKFGPLYDNAKKECTQVNETLKRLQDLIKDPKNHIYEYLSELKLSVELRREKIKVEIDMISDEMISKLEAFEKECYENLKDEKITQFIKPTEEQIKKGESLVEEWNKTLERLVIDEHKWTEIKLNAANLDIQLSNVIEKFENDLIMQKKWSHAKSDNIESEFVKELQLYEKYFR